MSSLKKSLIRLGYKKPELRSDLRPILDHLTQRKTARDPFYDYSQDGIQLAEKLTDESFGELQNLFDRLFTDKTPLRDLEIDVFEDGILYTWIRMPKEKALGWLNKEAKNPRSQFGKNQNLPITSRDLEFIKVDEDLEINYSENTLYFAFEYGMPEEGPYY